MGWLGWVTLATFIIGVLLCLPAVFARSGEDIMGAAAFVLIGVFLIIIAILVFLGKALFAVF